MYFYFVKIGTFYTIIRIYVTKKTLFCSVNSQNFWQFFISNIHFFQSYKYLFMYVSDGYTNLQHTTSGVRHIVQFLEQFVDTGNGCL